MKLSEFKPTEEVLERAGKCTTAEELVALAREYDVELTAEEISDILKYNSLIELNDEQLDQVSGGDSKKDLAQHLPPDHGPQISKYEAQGHIGERVYCVRNFDPNQFCWGILQRSYETRTFLWCTERVQDILVEGWNHDSDKQRVYTSNCSARYIDEHVPSGQLLESVVGDCCTLFSYKK